MVGGDTHIYTPMPRDPLATSSSSPTRHRLTIVADETLTRAFAQGLNVVCDETSVPYDAVCVQLLELSEEVEGNLLTVLTKLGDARPATFELDIGCVNFPGQVEPRSAEGRILCALKRITDYATTLHFWDGPFSSTWTLRLFLSHFAAFPAVRKLVITGLRADGSLPFPQTPQVERLVLYSLIQTSPATYFYKRFSSMTKLQLLWMDVDGTEDFDEMIHVRLFSYLPPSIVALNVKCRGEASVLIGDGDLMNANMESIELHGVGLSTLDPHTTSLRDVFARCTKLERFIFEWFAGFRDEFDGDFMDILRGLAAIPTNVSDGSGAPLGLRTLDFGSCPFNIDPVALYVAVLQRHRNIQRLYFDTTLSGGGHMERTPPTLADAIVRCLVPQPLRLVRGVVRLKCPYHPRLRALLGHVTQWELYLPDALTAQVVRFIDGIIDAADEKKTLNQTEIEFSDRYTSAEKLDMFSLVQNRLDALKTLRIVFDRPGDYDHTARDEAGRITARYLLPPTVERGWTDRIAQLQPQGAAEFDRAVLQESAALTAEYAQYTDAHAAENMRDEIVHVGFMNGKWAEVRILRDRLAELRTRAGTRDEAEAVVRLIHRRESVLRVYLATRR